MKLSFPQSASLLSASQTSITQSPITRDSFSSAVTEASPRIMVDPLTFGQKLELLLWLVDHYAERRGLKNSEMVRELRTKLGEVKQLATRRNDVFHGEVWIHAAEITVTLVNRHKGRSTEVKAIQRLTSDADLLFKSISLLLSQFDNRVATDGRPTKIPLGEPT
jgi:hypothetical protein